VVWTSRTASTRFLITRELEVITLTIGRVTGPSLKPRLPHRESGETLRPYSIGLAALAPACPRPRILQAQAFVHRERAASRSCWPRAADRRTEIEVVEQCVGDYVERLPLQQREYHAFCDPSGGSADSFTLAISHKEGERVVVDCVRETRPPFSPEATINDFVILLQGYRVGRITGDKCAGEFPRELFRRRGITYALCDKPKSDLYRDLLPALNSGRILLPRSERLTNQLVGLERRTTRAGKDSIDHAPGGHDDLANAVAGAFDVIAARPQLYLHYGGWGGYCRSVGGDDDEIDPADWASARRNVELGSTASSIAKGSDTPSDWTMRRNGLVP
jgi:hypothetical protein